MTAPVNGTTRHAFQSLVEWKGKLLASKELQTLEREGEPEVGEQQGTDAARAINKAVVLCGGEGTRLRPLSFSTPKHLIPVANRPVIEWILETLAEAGVTDVAVVVSPFNERVFHERIEEIAHPGMTVQFVVQEHPKGLAHAVACAETFVAGDPFLLYLGDNLFERGVTDLVSQHREHAPRATIALIEVPDPGRFGVARLDGRRILELIEKPKDPPSHWAVAGAYIFTEHIFDAIRRIKPSARGELEITDAIQRLIHEGRGVQAHFIGGWWKDVGQPADLILASELLMQAQETRMDGVIDDDSTVAGTVVLEEGAEVCGSRIVGPCILGKGVRIYDSDLGPNVVVGDRSCIVSSSVAHSIVMTDAHIEGMENLRGSIVGHRGQLKVSQSQTGQSVLVGDDSVLTLHKDGGQKKRKG